MLLNNAARTVRALRDPKIFFFLPNANMQGKIRRYDEERKMWMIRDVASAVVDDRERVEYKEDVEWRDTMETEKNLSKIRKRVEELIYYYGDGREEEDARSIEEEQEKHETAMDFFERTGCTPAWIDTSVGSAEENDLPRPLKRVRRKEDPHYG